MDSVNGLTDARTLPEAGFGRERADSGDDLVEVRRLQATFAEKGLPLLPLRRLPRQFVAEANRYGGRQFGVAPPERRFDGRLQFRTVYGAFLLEDIQIEVVLHAAVGSAEQNDRVQLLGDNRGT